jgi:hypothetical protein
MKTNRSTFSLLFYINTSKTKRNGRCPILGRISIDGKNAAFSTGLEIPLSDWDVIQGMAKDKSPESLAVNKQIAQYRAEITNHYKSMLENSEYCPD